MEIVRIVVGDFAVNCYVVADEKTKQAVVIDPGTDVERILVLLKENDWTVSRILLTHGHFDHAGGAKELADKYQVPFEMFKEDDFLYQDMQKMAMVYGLEWPAPGKIEKWLSDGEKIVVGDLNIEVLHTPGHSPGSCCFCIMDEKVVFTGDTVMRLSIGRTDLPGGDLSKLLDSARNQLSGLPKDFVLLPGHGEASSLEFEMEYNSYLSGSGYFV